MMNDNVNLTTTTAPSTLQGENTRDRVEGWLDRPLMFLWTWNWERVAWAVLLLVALVSRFADLGTRSMSHDESEHAWFAYNLYSGAGYQHSPVYHGPFAYHVLALFYLIFGDSTVMARVPTALFGMGAILLLWLMRRWIGRTGAFLTAVLVTLSPALLHYSRHTRHDIYEIFWALLFIVAVFRYLELGSGRPGNRWLYVAAGSLSLMMAIKEVSFIYGAAVGGFVLLIMIFRWLGGGEDSLPASEAGEETVSDAAYPPPIQRQPFVLARRDWRVLVIAVLLSVLGMVLFWVLGLGQATYDPAATGGLLQTVIRLLVILIPPAAAVALAAWHRSGASRDESPPQFSPVADVAILLGSLILPWLAPLPITLLGYDPLNYAFPGGILPSLSVLAGMIGIAIVVGVLWDARRWLIAAGIFYTLFILFFTTFFTNGQGIATGLVGSLGYWLSQQEVARGGQPWYYYLLITPLYEFLPLLLSLPVILLALLRRHTGQWALLALAAVMLVLWVLTGTAGQAAEGRTVVELINTVAMVAALLLLLLALAWGSLGRFPRPARYFLAFLPFWVLAAWITYTVAGEKMPWLVTHITLPMCITGGWWLGRLVEGTDWAQIRRRGGLWLGVLVVPLLAALAALFSSRPFQDRTLVGLSESSQWMAALAVGGLLLALMWRQAGRLGWRQAGRVLVLTGVVLLGLWTVRTSYTLNFINPDNVTEYLYYAHASPDPHRVMAQIEDISRRTVGDKQLKVAYDDDASWPFNWYLRDWPNGAYFGANPSREVLLSAPVAIVGSKNLDKVRPYLQRDYNEFDYRLIWWPDESYKGLNWEKIRQGIADPAKRKAFFDVIIWRRYGRPLAQWPLVHRFSLFVQKDLAAQLWDFGAQPAAVAAAVDPYEAGFRELASLRVIGSQGAGPGQLTFPRNVAVAADGTLYVADSGNHRIQVLDGQGNFLFGWGSTCELYLDGRPGCVDPDGDGPLQVGDGQMREPWGIAIGPQGNIYVADTWNHRIQVFDSQGNFLNKWGTNVTTAGEAIGSPGGFWGPRGIAIDGAGNLYVTDTGNKRVQAFDPDGNFLGQFGGGGVVEGRLDEPVGIHMVSTAEGQPGGELYVADTWNLRVQVFDVRFVSSQPEFIFLREWPIEGWSGQSVVNKPFLTVDGRGTVYLSDPENRRILVFDSQGAFKAAFGFYGSDALSFGLPNGVAMGPDGNLYVADADNHRIMVFPPIE